MAEGRDEHLFLSKVTSWTPRDIVAHLIGWNRYIVRGAREILRGRLPFYDVDPGPNYSKVNAALAREWADTDREALACVMSCSVRVENPPVMSGIEPETAVFHITGRERHEEYELTAGIASGTACDVAARTVPEDAFQPVAHAAKHEAYRVCSPALPNPRSGCRS